jgi:hypothetical protein
MDADSFNQSISVIVLKSQTSVYQLLAVDEVSKTINLGGSQSIINIGVLVLYWAKDVVSYSPSVSILVISPTTEYQHSRMDVISYSMFLFIIVVTSPTSTLVY